jgi:hypothetical protein
MIDYFSKNKGEGYNSYKNIGREIYGTQVEYIQSGVAKVAQGQTWRFCIDYRLLMLLRRWRFWTYTTIRRCGSSTCKIVYIALLCAE